MRQIPMLACVVVVIPATFSIGGCAGGASRGQGGRDHTTHLQGANVKLDLHPEHHSGVGGTASFGDASDRVVVKLGLRDLSRPNTLYLAHVRPGTCAEGKTHEHGGAYGSEEGYGQKHGGASHEHGEPVTSTVSALRSSTHSRR
jgi:hypothetical protein